MPLKGRELRDKNTGEIERELEAKWKALRELRFQIASREAKNYRSGRVWRKEIARMLTVLGERARQTKEAPVTPSVL